MNQPAFGLPLVKPFLLSNLFYQYAVWNSNQLKNVVSTQNDIRESQYFFHNQLIRFTDIELDQILAIYTTPILDIDQVSSIIDHLKQLFIRAVEYNKEIYTEYFIGIKVVATVLFSEIHYKNYEYYFLSDCVTHYNTLYRNGTKENYNFMQMVANTKPWKVYSHSLFYKGQNEEGIVTESNMESIYTESINRSIILTEKIRSIVENINRYHIHQLPIRNKIPLNFNEMIKSNDNNRHIYTNTYQSLLKLMWVSTFKNMGVSMFDLFDLSLLNEDSVLSKSHILQIINMALVFKLGYDDDDDNESKIMSLDDFVSQKIGIHEVTKRFISETSEIRDNYLTAVSHRLQSTLDDDGGSTTNFYLLQLSLDKITDLRNTARNRFYRPSNHALLHLFNVANEPGNKEKRAHKLYMKTMERNAYKERDEFERRQRSLISITSESFLKTKMDRYVLYANFLWINHIDRIIDTSVKLIHLQRLHNLDLKLDLSKSYKLYDLMSFTVTTNLELDNVDGRINFNMGKIGAIVLEILIKTDKKFYHIFNTSENNEVYGFQIYVISKTERGASRPRWSFISTETASPPTPKFRPIAYKHFATKIPLEFNPRGYTPEFSNVSQFYSTIIYPSTKLMSVIKSNLIETYKPDQIFIRFIKVMWIIELISYGVLTPTDYGARQWFHEYVTNIIHIDPKRFIDYYLDKLKSLDN